MHRWWTAARAAASLVADSPGLWLPGALAWTVTTGWLVLLLGVARAPTVAELTFLGAGIVTSGAWPWNALAIGAGIALATLVAFLLAAVAEGVLLGGRRITVATVVRLFALGLVTAAPALAALLLLAIAAALVSPAEFNAPDPGTGPVARTALRVLPVVLVVLLLAAAGGAVHAGAARAVLGGKVRLLDGLRRGAAQLGSRPVASVLQVATLLLARLGYLAVAVVLLRVLWMPIGERFGAGEIDVGVSLLLVGFVAIWLCLVLGGGALHAWGSVTWSLVLEPARDHGTGRGDRMENSPTP